MINTPRQQKNWRGLWALLTLPPFPNGTWRGIFKSPARLTTTTRSHARKHASLAATIWRAADNKFLLKSLTDSSLTNVWHLSKQRYISGKPPPPNVGSNVTYSHSSEQGDVALLKHQKWLQSNNINTTVSVTFCPQSSTQSKTTQLTRQFLWCTASSSSFCKCEASFKKSNFAAWQNHRARWPSSRDACRKTPLARAALQYLSGLRPATSPPTQKWAGPSLQLLRAFTHESSEECLRQPITALRIPSFAYVLALVVPPSRAPDHQGPARAQWKTTVVGVASTGWKSRHAIKCSRIYKRSFLFLPARSSLSQIIKGYIYF